MTTTWVNPLLFSIGILLMVTSLAANILVVFALTFKKRTRLPVFNILMLAQSLISLMDVACNMPLTAVSAFHNQWPLAGESGEIHLCRFHAFFNAVIPTARILLVTVMGLDRVVAVYSPMNYPDRITRERAWCMVIYCWVHAFAVYISMLADATPVSYRKHHYACLIASTAPQSYVIILVTFGYAIPVLFVSVFLLMILRKYIVQEPVISVVEDASNNYPQVLSGDSSLGDSRSTRKKLRSKNSCRSVSDYEVAGYVSVLFLVWLLCQSPLLVTLTSDLILSNNDSNNDKAAINITNHTTVTVQPVTLSCANCTSNVTAVDTEVDKYQQMFPREFQTIIQYLNFVPSLVIPILTFFLYRTVWSRLKHVIAKSRFARRHNHSLSVEDEDLSFVADTTSRSRNYLQNPAASRQRIRHRNRMAVDCNPNLPEATITINSTSDSSTVEQNDLQRPMSRFGTPVLLATSDGLLLHQVVRNRQLAAGGAGDIGLEYVVDENGYFGKVESDADNVPLEQSDAMTGSCNSNKPLLQGCDVAPTDALTNSFHAIPLPPRANNIINADATNDSGIEDSPTAKPKSEIANELSSDMKTHHPNQHAGVGQNKGTFSIVSPASTSSIRPMVSEAEPSYYHPAPWSPSPIGVAPQQTASSVFPLNIGEMARNSVNMTVRRIFGSTSPKSKYRASSNSVFVVSSAASNCDGNATLLEHTQQSNNNGEPSFRSLSGQDQVVLQQNTGVLLLAAPPPPRPQTGHKTVHVNSSSSVTPYNNSDFNSGSDFLKNVNQKF